MAQHYSAPSLVDLLNETNVLAALDKDNVACLEEEWFNQPDLYDLTELDQADATNVDDEIIVRCSTQWKVAEFVKLDSILLKSLIKHLEGDSTVLVVGVMPLIPLSSLLAHLAVQMTGIWTSTASYSLYHHFQNHFFI